MTKRLDGTTALVTGASSGIGAATALALVAEGASVALAARRRDRLEELAKQIETEGGRALVLEVDVTQQAQAREAVERSRRARPARHPGQQRRRDAARSHHRGSRRGVAAHGRAQRARPHVLRARPRCPTCWRPPRTARAGSPTW